MSPGPPAIAASIVDLWLELGSTLDRQEIYKRACRAAVISLSVHRSTFVTFDEDLSRGKVCAEYCAPDIHISSALDLVIPITGVAEEMPLVVEHRPVQYSDVNSQVAPGIFKDNLIMLGVTAVLIVPVVGKMRLIGSISLDRVDGAHNFTEDELRLCTMLAQWIAIALDHSTVYSLERHRHNLLLALGGSKDQLGRAANETELRGVLADGAQHLAKPDATALYRFDPGVTEYRLAAHRTPPSDHVAKFVPRTLHTDHWVRSAVEHNIEHADSVVIERVALPVWQQEDTLIAGFATALLVFVKPFGKLDSVLVLLYERREERLLKVDTEYLVLLVAHFNNVFEKQEWWNSVSEKLALQYLSLLGTWPRTEVELNTVFSHFLTLLTANFGLGFNRALFCSYDSRDRSLTPKLAIGHMDGEGWEHSCQSDRQKGLDTFEEWFKLVRSGAQRTASPLETAFAHADPIQWSAFPFSLQQQFLKRDWVHPEVTHGGLIPLPIAAVLNPTREVVVSPVGWGSELYGVVFADKEFSAQPIGERDLRLVRMFCHYTALSLERYFQSQRVFRTNRLGTADDATLGHLQPNEFLERLCEDTRDIFEAKYVCVRLSDTQSGAARYASSPYLTDAVAASLLNEDLAQLALSTGFAQVFDDSLEPTSQNTPFGIEIFRAGYCLPITSERRTVGVMWIVFIDVLRVAEPQDIAGLQRFAAEVSSVFGSWRRLFDTVQLQKATNEISAALPLGSALHRMAEVAQSLFGADVVTFWPFDSRRQTFVTDRVIRVGVNGYLPPPAPNGRTYRLLKENGYLAICNVRSGDHDLSMSTLEFLHRNQINSLQGIAVRSGTDALGVLYLGYSETCAFDVEERRRVEGFTRAIAVLVQTARAFEHSQEVNDVALEVSRLLALGNEAETLKSVIKKAYSALRSDSVILFRYHRDTRALEFPPLAEGTLDRNRMVAEDEGEANQFIPDLIRRGVTTIGTKEDLQLLETRFARDEGIRTVIAVPLIFQTWPVGLMIVNYRQEIPAFDLPALRSLSELLASHAAVAIGNVLRIRALTTLSTELLDQANSGRAYQAALDFAFKQLDVQFGAIVLQENQQMRVVAHKGWVAPLFKGSVEPTSHAGYTILHEPANSFPDLKNVLSDTRYRGRFEPPPRMLKAKIVSGIGVRFGDGTVTGALVLHSNHARDFTPEDMVFLRLVATQALTVHNASRIYSQIAAQYKVAKDIVNQRQVDQPRPALRSLIDACFEFIVDERAVTKVSYANCELYKLYPGLSIERGAFDESGTSISARILDGGDPVGVITVQSRRARTFDAFDVETLQGLATLGAIIVRSARDARDFRETLLIIHHELRDNYTGGFNLAAQLIEESFGPVPPGQVEQLRGIQMALSRMERLRQNLQYMVKIMSGELSLKPIGISADRLFDLLLGARNRFSASAALKEVEVVCKLDCHPESGPYGADLDLLAHVVDNLLENGIKYSPERGRLVASVRNVESGLVMEFEDQGQGVRDEERLHVFRMYYQSEDHKGQHVTGFGAGLAISHTIIDKHRGSIGVESPIRNGRGSRFWFRIPRYIREGL